MTIAALITLAKARLTTPPGSYIAIVAAALIGLWVVHHHGYTSGYAECTAARETAAKTEIARQEKAGTAVVQRAETTAVAGATKDKSNQGIIRDVAKTVAAQPDAGAECLPAAVADRLRDID